MLDYRICQLDPKDGAFGNGARWALMAPVWVGDEVEIRATKFQTLSDAITGAKKSTPLYCDMHAVVLADKRAHGDPMTTEKAESWVGHVRACAAEGSKNAVADLGII